MDTQVGMEEARQEVLAVLVAVVQRTLVMPVVPRIQVAQVSPHHSSMATTDTLVANHNPQRSSMISGVVEVEAVLVAWRSLTWEVLVSISTSAQVATGTEVVVGVPQKHHQRSLALPTRCHYQALMPELVDTRQTQHLWLVATPQPTQVVVVVEVSPEDRLEFRVVTAVLVSC